MDTYVYGVLRASAGKRSSADGVEGRPVERVVDGELAAIVSDAPSVPVRANRRNLLAHSDILAGEIADHCVLPMQFGVVMPSREAVASELLRAHAEWLAEQLEALDPYVQLSVRALCPEEALLRSVVAEHPEIASLRASLEDQSEEASYYERIRLGELVARAVEERREDTAARIAGALEPLASAGTAGDVLHEQMLANLAFLVERDRVQRFDAAVQSLDEELGPDVVLRYLGPLPAHDFVDLGSELESRAWA